MAKPILKSYEDYCAAHKIRASEPRRFVLEIIAAAKKPLTAYEVLDRLGAKIKNPKPPTAYRALDALTAHGFVHRIESLNAYIACHENHRHQGSQFMICDSCGAVEEIHLCSIPDSLKKQALEKSFTVRRWNVELHGECRSCTATDIKKIAKGTHA